MSSSDPVSRPLVARRIVLALTGLAFLAIALGSLAAPQRMAEPLGYTLDSTNAHNEFRAIYVGLWLAHVWILAWAAWRIRQRVLGDVAGILILGQVLGRVLSVALDGLPDAQILPVAVAELVGGALILLLRGKSASH